MKKNGLSNEVIVIIDLLRFKACKPHTFKKIFSIENFILLFTFRKLIKVLFQAYYVVW